MTINEKIISLLKKNMKDLDGMVEIFGAGSRDACIGYGTNVGIKLSIEVIQSLEFEVYEDNIILRSKE